ncbi:MAG: DAK2 domain-containing protein [Acidimicrobiales bacterium]
MVTLDRLGADHLATAVSVFRDALRSHQEAINRLNVYPVPDGDTGTNMALTLESVVAALDGVEGMAATCQAMARGSLMGARGNSGVILSQILRGLSEKWASGATVGPAELAAGLARASEAADAAVMRPVEGTILTVLRAAAAAATEAAGQGKALVDVLAAAQVVGADALARTPEQLPVLKQAGVVDAGGVGFMLLLDALLKVVDDRPLPEPAAVTAGPSPAESIGHDDAGGDHGDNQGDDQGYEVMYLLDADDDAVAELKQAWAAIGDSIVVVGGDGLWNCHIHTDHVGPAIEAALEVGGRPRQIRVTDLRQEVATEACRRDPSPAEPGAESEKSGATTAVVVVASGDGLERLFRSLGVAAVVAGGQSMNPSTAELLAAVDGVAADQVVLLPNNANIVPVARQVDALTPKMVRVVATTGVAQGLAAMLPFDAHTNAIDNAAAMAEAADAVVSGEVTRAVRSATTEAGPVAEGDWLGVSEGRVRAIAPATAGPAGAAAKLLDLLVASDHELVTVVVGEGVADEHTGAVTAWLADHRPAIAVEVHQGGQPLYCWLFAVE